MEGSTQALPVSEIWSPALRSSQAAACPGHQGGRRSRGSLWVRMLLLCFLFSHVSFVKPTIFFFFGRAKKTNLEKFGHLCILARVDTVYFKIGL